MPCTNPMFILLYTDIISIHNIIIMKITNLYYIKQTNTYITNSHT